MTSTYALQRLLQHGPMRRSELIEVTGWPERRVDKALYATTCDGRVQEVRGQYGRFYSLPASSFMRDLSAVEGV